jgi:hypothetical protein
LTIAAKLRGPIAASSSSVEEESISRCKRSQYYSLFMSFAVSWVLSCRARKSTLSTQVGWRQDWRRWLGRLWQLCFI